MNPAMHAFIEAHQPCTARQVADGLGVTRRAVTRQHERGELRISDWLRDQRYGIRVARYSLSTPKASQAVTRWVGDKYPGAM